MNLRRRRLPFGSFGLALIGAYQLLYSLAVSKDVRLSDAWLLRLSGALLRGLTV